jgi:hypothetical protein
MITPVYIISPMLFSSPVMKSHFAFPGLAHMRRELQIHVSKICLLSQEPLSILAYHIPQPPTFVLSATA